MSTHKAIERRPGFFETWSRFWFLPIDPIGLHGLRTFAGLLVLAWLLGFAGRHDALFGLEGWFDLQAYRESGSLGNGADNEPRDRSVAEDLDRCSPALWVRATRRARNESTCATKAPRWLQRVR